MADEKAAKTEDVVADFTSDWRWMQFLKFLRKNNVSVVVKRTGTV
jgi:dihydrodipicolinate reductase